MADNNALTSGSGGQGATGNIPAGGSLLGTKPSTTSRAREVGEKDDGMTVKNPQVMEDYRKALEKQKHVKSGAEGAQGEETAGDETKGKGAAKQ